MLQNKNVRIALVVILLILLFAMMNFRNVPAETPATAEEPSAPETPVTETEESGWYTSGSFLTDSLIAIGAAAAAAVLWTRGKKK